MADRYIAITEDGLDEVQGTVTGGTATQAGDLVALDATGHIDPSLLPAEMETGGFTATAAENLTAGDLVAINNTGGLVRAVATNPRPAVGFVTEGFASGATATFFTTGANAYLTGLTVHRIYYLSSTTPGAVSLTPPEAGSDEYWQEIGVAFSATTLNFKPSVSVKRSA